MTAAVAVAVGALTVAGAGVADAVTTGCTTAVEARVAVNVAVATRAGSVATGVGLFSPPDEQDTATIAVITTAATFLMFIRCFKTVDRAMPARLCQRLLTW